MTGVLWKAGTDPVGGYPNRKWVACGWDGILFHKPALLASLQTDQLEAGISPQLGGCGQQTRTGSFGYARWEASQVQRLGLIHRPR